MEPHTRSRKCPFFGFRWPDRTSDLYQIGGSECGLDLDNNGPCRMELEGCEIDFDHCPTADAARWFLAAAEDRIRFYPSGTEQGIPLDDWTDRVMRSEERR